MKTQISLLVALLAIAPHFLSAQIETEATLVSSPSPLEAAADPDASCAPESKPAFAADANETSPDILKHYERAHRLMLKGAWRRARIELRQGITKFPESRHLRMLYADLLWHLSGGGKDRTLLDQSAEQAIRAMEIGLDLEIVDHGLIDRLSQTLAKTWNEDAFERLFSRALALDPGPFPHRQYALGLGRMDSPRAEDAFKAAVALQTEGDAHADYGEWLLDRNRDADALEMLPQAPKQIYYLHFLRGVALERSNFPGEARQAYNAFRDFSASFPAPARFRIQGSKIQRASGIHFDDEKGQRHTTMPGGLRGLSAAALTDQQGINGLSYMIYGEAIGENYGGKLAVGWVARARVLRGTVEVAQPCPYVIRSGTTLADWYKSVICQSGAFYGACSAWCSNPTTTSCSSSADTNSAAYDVFHGKKADPVSTHCPGGVVTNGNFCSSPFKTCAGSFYSYLLASPLFQTSVGSGVACPSSCSPNNYGKICGNGGSDHCFYGNRTCAGTNRYGYEGTITAVGNSMVTAAYYHDGRTTHPHRGHLEGPETGVNFDLYLQHSSSASGPWTDVAWTRQPSAIEDVDYTTSVVGYYRWRVVAVSGTGYWFGCTRRP